MASYQLSHAQSHHLSDRRIYPEGLSPSITSKMASTLPTSFISRPLGPIPRPRDPPLSEDPPLEASAAQSYQRPPMDLDLEWEDPGATETTIRGRADGSSDENETFRRLRRLSGPDMSARYVMIGLRCIFELCICTTFIPKAEGRTSLARTFTHVSFPSHLHFSFPSPLYFLHQIIHFISLSNHSRCVNVPFRNINYAQRTTSIPCNISI